MNRQNIKIITHAGNALDNNDWQDIANFMKQFPNRVKRSSGPNYYKSKLLYSPNGTSYVTRALDSRGYCVGLTTLTKKKFIVDNKNYNAFELGDSYVSIKFQGQGIYSRILSDTLLNIKKKEDCKFIYSTPNTNSMPGLIKKGFILSNYQIHSKLLPLRFNQLFKFPLLKYLVSIYLFFLKIYLKINSKSNEITLINIKDISNLPNEFNPNNQLEQHRSKEYLDWRFIKNPDEYLIYAVYLRKNYLGYLVLKEGLHNSAKTIYLADIFIDKKYLSYVSKVLSKILLKNFNKYAFASTWISKKSIFWKQISYCFPI